ncbi:MAG: transcription elongation factor subunit Spt4, partial [Nanoarchaeota archaeon]
KVYVEGVTCPQCKGNQFATVHQGKLNILDANKSFIAKQIGIKEKGRYAIKVR